MLTGTCHSPVRLSLREILLTAFCLMSLSLAAQAQSSGQTTAPSPLPPPVAVQKPITVKAVEDASAPAGWKRYEIGDGPLLSVLLPHQPEEHTSQEELGGEKPSTMRIYSATAGGVIYSALYAEDLPFIAERMPETYKQAFFEGMWKGFVQGMREGMEKNGVLFKVTPLSQRPVTISGLKGSEQEFILGPMQGRAQIAMAGQRAFMLLAFWMDDKTTSERTAFFNSFQIGPGRSAPRGTQQ